MTGESIWSVDGGDGRRYILTELVRRHLEGVEELLPDDYDDPMDQLVAELNDRPDHLVAADPELERLFPPALADADEAQQFRADAVVQQARARYDAASAVLEDLTADDDDEIEVPVEHMDAWVRTLTALRAQWHVALTGSGERLAEASVRDHRRNPTASAVCDWLGYLVEDALQTLSVARGDA